MIAGAIMEISDNIKFKPTTFVKATAAAPLEADLTASFLFNEMISAGLMVRQSHDWRGSRK